MLSSLERAINRILPKEGFARGVSVLASGTAAGQAIVIASSPILTRLYSPEDFGLLAVFGGLLGIIGVIASLRYQLAIPLPEADREGGSVLALSLLVLLGFTGLISLALFFFGSELVYVLDVPALAPFLWALPVGLFLLGVYQIGQYWAIRKREFGAIAKTSFNQSLSMVIVQVSGFAFGPIMLIFGRLVGQSVAVISLIRWALWADRDQFRDKSRTEIVEVAGRYRNFPLISTWTGLASSAGSNIPPLLIATLLGAGSAGLFALAFRVLSQPMAVIGQAVSDAFYQRAVIAKREDSLAEAVHDVFATLTMLSMPLALMGFIVAPDIFIVVFGSDWEVAGEIARWMTPWLFFQFVVSPCTGIFPVIDRHDIAFRFQISLLVASILGVVIGGGMIGDLLWTVIIISVLSSFVYLWRVVATYHVLRSKALLPLSVLCRSIPVSIVTNVPLVFLYVAGYSSNILMFSVVLTLSLVVWGLFCLKPVLREVKRG
ncbi:MAG: oligosaccharide flippase family protein [Alteromonadaceae bacterium]|nr:oligosaccharide flippase family protein [Alteromonadaceae bacterium]